MATNIKIEDHSAAFLKELEDQSLKAMRKSLRTGVAAAKEKVPVRTGELRDSIGAKIVKRGELLEGTLGAGNDKAWYPHIIEFGSEITKAQPFLGPATDVLDQAWQQDFTQAYDKLVRKTNKGSGK